MERRPPVSVALCVSDEHHRPVSDTVSGWYSRYGPWGVFAVVPDVEGEGDSQTAVFAVLCSEGNRGVLQKVRVCG